MSNKQKAESMSIDYPCWKEYRKQKLINENLIKFVWDRG